MKKDGKILTVIQADLGPNWCKVPGLALDKLKGKTVLEQTYSRLQASKSVNEILVIFPFRPENHALSVFCHYKGWHFQATGGDKLAALLSTARVRGADTIIRVNAEQPAIDPGLIDAMLEKHLDAKVDYTYMVGAPNGTGPEIVSKHGLNELYRKLSDTSLRLEPPTIPLRNMNSTVTVQQFRVEGDKYMPGMRLTADTRSRLNGLEDIFTKFPGEADLKDIVSTLKLQPDWHKVTPFYLNLEPTNVCNLNCIMCDRKEFPRGMGFMDMEMYKSIINDAVQCSVNQIFFAGVGEPLLHKKIMEMIRIAKDSGISRVHLTTNACFLDEKKGRELIDSGLDLLIVSLDGATKKTYEKIRVGAKYDQVIGNVKDFLALKRELKVKTPAVQVQIIKMTDTEEEMKEFRNMWEPHLNPEDFIREVLYWSFGGNVEDRRTKDQKNFKKIPCWLPWQSMTIYWDGSVPMCCRDYRATYKMGDITEKSMIDIWNDKPIRNIRKHLGNDNYGITKLCENCEGGY